MTRIKSETQVRAAVTELAWAQLPATAAYCVDVALRDPPSSGSSRDVVEARLESWKPVMDAARQLDPWVRAELVTIMAAHVRAPVTTGEVLACPWPEGHRLHPDAVGCDVDGGVDE